MNDHLMHLFAILSAQSIFNADMQLQKALHSHLKSFLYQLRKAKNTFFLSIDFLSSLVSDQRMNHTPFSPFTVTSLFAT